MEETVAPANTFIEFKSPISKWNNFIFIGVFIFLILVTFTLFGMALGPIYVFVIFAFAFISYYFARYWSMAYTTITVENNSITINQSSQRLNKHKAISFKLAELRGFEIAEITRSNYALILYDNSFAYYKYSLPKTKDQLALQAFLTPYLPLLNKKANPLFRSFGTAFLFVLKRISIFQFLNFATLCILFGLDKYVKGIFPLIPLILLSLGLATFFWWFLVRRPFQRHYFRFSAFYWATHLVFYLAILLFFPIMSKVNDIRVTPMAINRAFEILGHRPNQLYTIKQLSYHPDSILLTDYIVQPKGKSATYPIDHLYATPLGSGDTIRKNGLYNIWLVKTTTQSIKKNNDFEQKINHFHQEANTQFTSALATKPIFYKLTNDTDLAHLVSSSINASKRFNVLLEPHWESLNAYKNKNWGQLCLLILLLVAFNLFGCLIFTFNR